MKTKKRTKPEWVGRHWSVYIDDGNGERWLEFFPDCPLGAFGRWHGNMTPKEASDISRAFREAAEWVDENVAPEGTGEVVAFPKKP